MVFLQIILSVMVDKRFSIEETLNAFINRFHTAVLIQGIIRFIILLVIAFGLLWISDWLLFFTVYQRLSAVLLFSVLSLFSFIVWVLKPLLALLFNLGRLSLLKAIMLISKETPDLEDRLINWYYLRTSLNTTDNVLLAAAVDQQVERLRKFDLVSWLKIWPSNALLITLGMMIFIQFVPIVLYTSDFIDTSKRLVRPTGFYKEKAPFTFKLVNQNLTVYKYESLTLELLIEGSAIPKDIFLVTDSSELLLTHLGKGRFQFHFPQIVKSFTFNFKGGNFVSEAYRVEVLEKPTIQALKASVIFPSYLQMSSKVFEGASDLEIPEGSTVTWSIRSSLASKVTLGLRSMGDLVGKENRPVFNFEHRFIKNDDVLVKVFNERNLCTDSLSFVVKVIRDEVPSIAAAIIDKNEVTGQFDFEGIVSDDHGISGVKFVVLSGGSVIYEEIIPIQPGALSQRFYFSFNSERMTSDNGVERMGQFIVLDNNFETGPNKAFSTLFSLSKLTDKEINNLADSLGNGVRNRLESLLGISKDEQDKLQKLKKEIRTDGKFDWKEKKELQAIMESKKQEALSIEELRKKLLKESEIREKSMEPFSEVIKKKQEKIQDLMKEVFDKDLLKQIDQLQKALDSISMDKIGTKMEELEDLLKKTDQALDRNLSLLEQLKRDFELEKLASSLNKLHEEQKSLNEDRLSGKDNNPAIRQDSLISELEEEVMKDIQKIDSLSNKIDSKQIDDDIKSHLNEAKRLMKEGSKSDKKGSVKKASEAGNKAEEELKLAADELNQMMNEEEEQSSQEDFEDIRQLIENTLEVSFRQEQLISEVNGVNLSSPNYVDIGRKQRWVKDDVLGIKDSLIALSKRNVNIPEFIFDKLDVIGSRLTSVLSSHQERRISDVMSGQQFVMSELNNLVLILSEVETQMKKQSQSMNSSGQCKSNKPSKGGKGKASLKKIKDMQKQLGEELSKMKEQMNSKQKGKKGEGEKGEDNQFGKMAMEQMMIRKQLEELRESYKQEMGDIPGELNRVNDEMEKLEQDLLFKRLNDQTIKRQEQIETRLLKSEKALEEREMENKRESKVGNMDQIGNPFEDILYKGNIKGQENILNRENIRLSPYYRAKSNEYLNHNLQYGKE